MKPPERPASRPAPRAPPARAVRVPRTESLALVRSSRLSHTYSPASSARRPDTVRERRSPSAAIWKRLPARSCVLPQRHTTSACAGLSSQASVTVPPSSPLTGSRGWQNLAATSAEGKDVSPEALGPWRPAVLCFGVVRPEPHPHPLPDKTPPARPQRDPAGAGFAEDCADR